MRVGTESKISRKALLSLIALSVVVLGTGKVSADQLCGRTFSSFEQLYAELNGDRTHRMRMNDPRVAMFIDVVGTTWRLTKKGNPAFPAVSCMRVVVKNGKQELEQHLWCRGPGKWTCEEFIAGYTQPFEWK